MKINVTKGKKSIMVTSSEALTTLAVHVLGQARQSELSYEMMK